MKTGLVQPEEKSRDSLSPANGSVRTSIGTESRKSANLKRSTLLKTSSRKSGDKLKIVMRSEIKRSLNPKPEISAQLALRFTESSKTLRTTSMPVTGHQKTSSMPAPGSVTAFQMTHLKTRTSTKHGTTSRKKQKSMDGLENKPSQSCSTAWSSARRLRKTRAQTSDQLPQVAAMRVKPTEYREKKDVRDPWVKLHKSQDKPHSNLTNEFSTKPRDERQLSYLLLKSDFGQIFTKPFYA